MGLGIQELNGMRLKGKDDCLALFVSGVLDDPFDDLLMAEMEAVVAANGHGRGGEIVLGKGEVIDDPHEAPFPVPLTRAVR